MENGLPTNYGVWTAIELPRGRPDLVVGVPESAFRREPHLAADNRTTAKLPWAGRNRRKPTHFSLSRPAALGGSLAAGRDRLIPGGVEFNGDCVSLSLHLNLSASGDVGRTLCLRGWLRVRKS